jgi:hypothetical protein
LKEVTELHFLSFLEIRMTNGYRVLGMVFVVVFLFLFTGGCSQDQAPSPKAQKPASTQAVQPAAPGAPAQSRPTPGAGPSAPSSVRPATELKSSGSPVIIEVSIEPSAPVSGDQLKAIIKTKDPLGADAVLVYRWTVNGMVAQESKSNALEQAVSKGDYVEVAVGAEGDLALGKFVTSNVRVGNAPPAVRLVSQSLSKEGLYEAHLESTDPERSTISYVLKKGPQGMSINSSGLIQWNAGAGAQGVSDVLVSAQDVEGGETLLSYQITIRRESMKGEEDGGAPKQAPK